MITIEAVDQTYFINVDDYYNIKDALSDENKGVSALLFDECTVLDEKFESITLNGLKEFGSLSEWKKFKSMLIEKFNNIEKYIMLYIDRADRVNESGDEDDARSYWNDSEDDSYPKDSFDSFEDWFGSQNYYEWENDNRRIYWNDFTSENTDIHSNLDTDDYFDHYGNIYARGMRKVLDVMQNRISELIKEVDNENSGRISENKYDAIEYIFEY